MRKARMYQVQPGPDRTLLIDVGVLREDDTTIVRVMSPVPADYAAKYQGEPDIKASLADLMSYVLANEPALSAEALDAIEAQAADEAKAVEWQAIADKFLGSEPFDRVLE